MSWRKWNRIIHRDVGYIAFGLTLVYAISGFAVNHIHTWNSNYDIETVNTNIGPVAEISTAVTDADLKTILVKLNEAGLVRSTFPTSPEILHIFLEERSIELNVVTGDVVHEKITPRAGFFQLNQLHLNRLHSSNWTLMADAFAVVLIFLAISGIIMIKGKKGLAGRGKWLTAIGIAIPIVFLWLN